MPLPDPLQTNWTKDGKVGSLTGYVNPIVNDTGRDPSTAWKTPAGMSNAAATPCPSVREKAALGWFDLNLWVVGLVAGEWRITSYGSQIMGSMDFKSWCVLVWLVCFGCTDGLSAL